ncbi:response regulator [Polaromonas sp.]|nr:response regulator [Candidatus Saccharibacteria bacterium]
MGAYKVCVIEDEPSIAAMYEFKLRLEGYDVTVAHSGSDGLKLIKAESPDLILLDLKMPHMSGDEMLEKLRATSWGSGVRVIILTNISKNEAPQKLRFLNVDRYVVKAHHTPAQIVAIVDETLGNFRDKK